jgi:hypothetical protein
MLLLECAWDGELDLASITDRVEAVGGTIEEGARSLRLTIPVAAEQHSALVGAPAGPGV